MIAQAASAIRPALPALANPHPTPTPPNHPETPIPHPTEHLLLLLNFLNTTAELLLPCFIILHTRAELLPGFALTMATCILWLKLVSYAHVNWDFRWGLPARCLRGCCKALPGL